MNEPKKQLVRALTLTDATSIVVGGVIGTGVFLKTAVMTQQLGSPVLVMLAWVAAGLLSLAGALTYAELGAMFPRTGGEYVYLNKAYGEVPAFLWGWMQVAVAATGAIAAISTGFAIFLSALVPMGGAWVERNFNLFGQEIHWQLGLQQVVAVAAIIFFSAINCLGVAVGGRVQSVLTGAKILIIAAIVAGVFFLSPSARWSNLVAPASATQWGMVQSFGAGMIAASWAYSGWYSLPIVAGEVRNPERNVPRALIFGMLAVMLVYVLTNLSYFYALPVSEVTTSNSSAHPDAMPVAAKAVQTFSGSLGLGLISIAFVVSIAGSLNAVILGTARVPYAMARDGLFFSRLGKVSSSSHVPVWAILFQAVWASVLALSGTFDQLTTYSIFALWLFYGVTAIAVFVLRRKMPEARRPYRTLGYPVVPLLSVLGAAWLVINTIQTSPIESAVGLLLIALGLPVYFFFKLSRRQAK
ncbi:MAG: amino acid permease [Pyrinomonadaceae bacterium]|nr:amino acid permease [Pyrinomonadaceae bacterium]